MSDIIKSVDTKNMEQEKAVVSVTGTNHTGIVAKLATTIANDNGNFLDIQQTIVNDFFTMVLVVEISKLSCDFSIFKEHILTVGEKIGVDVKVIHEDVLHAMHRI